jgi:hypothetical protein
MRFSGSFLLTLALGALVLLAARSCDGAGLAVYWDPSPDTNAIGYYVYYGPLGSSQTNRMDVGPATNALLSPLIPGVTYFVYVTAYDSACNESDPSNVINYTVPVPSVIVTLATAGTVDGPWTNIFAVTNATTNSVFYRTRIHRSP